MTGPGTHCAHGTSWPRCLQCHALGVKLPDLRMVEPELLEDDIEAALYDSLDQDWTVADGANAIMRLMFRLARSSAECASCGGLNISCPEGCGRDPETGELSGLALAAATGTAKTRNAAECKASQSGGSASERNAQKDPSHD